MSLRPSPVEKKVRPSLCPKFDLLARPSAPLNPAKDFREKLLALFFQTRYVREKERICASLLPISVLPQFSTERDEKRETFFFSLPNPRRRTQLSSSSFSLPLPTSSFACFPTPPKRERKAKKVLQYLFPHLPLSIQRLGREREEEREGEGVASGSLHGTKGGRRKTNSGASLSVPTAISRLLLLLGLLYFRVRWREGDLLGVYRLGFAPPPPSIESPPQTERTIKTVCAAPSTQLCRCLILRRTEKRPLKACSSPICGDSTATNKKGSKVHDDILYFSASHIVMSCVLQ